MSTQEIEVAHMPFFIAKYCDETDAMALIWGFSARRIVTDTLELHPCKWTRLTFSAPRRLLQLWRVDLALPYVCKKLLDVCSHSSILHGVRHPANLFEKFDARGR